MTRWPSSIICPRSPASSPKPSRRGSATSPTMRLPGNRAHALPLPPEGDAALVLRDAQGRELAGCLSEAIEGYRAAIDAAERSATPAVRVEALRRLAVAHYRRDEREPARALCRRGYQGAMARGGGRRAAGC